VWVNIPPQRWVPVTYLLIGINIAVFLAMIASGVSLIFPGADQLLHWGANFGPHTLHGQYWRLVTSCFLHVGILHLLSNLLFLLLFAGVAERLFGPLTTAGIYLLTGIAASLLSVAWSPMTIKAGASGAIFGLGGVLITVRFYGRFFDRLTLPKKLLGYVSRLALYLLIFGLFPIPGIDHIAHWGGLITGLFLGFWLIRLLRKPTESRRVLASAWLFKGRTAMDNREYESAIRYLQAYSASHPKDGYGHLLLGYLLQAAKRHDEAAAEYERGLTLRQDDPAVRTKLAEIYLLRGKAREALALLGRREC
jgi:membrane associated rhomboid family serine protease